MAGARTVGLTVMTLVLTLAAGCGAPTPDPQSVRPRVTADFGPPGIRGLAYHGMWTSRDHQDRAEILDAIAAAGIPWVRMDVGWTTLQPDGPSQFDPAGVALLDERLREVSDRGLRALIMFWWAPPWSSGTQDKNGIPSDPGDYARAAAWMVARWPAEIAALQVWNEPNLPEFFASPRPADYAPLLTATYDAVKAVRPDVTVVTAGPAHLDHDWYRGLYAQGVIGAFDALGVHAYPIPGDAPPRDCRQDSSGCDVEWLVEYTSTRGAPDIWVTEMGWSTAPDDSTAPAWQRGVTETQQARYTAGMLAWLSTMRRVKAAFVYRDRDFAPVQTHLDGFGVLRADTSAKPAFGVVTCPSRHACRVIARP
jgi:hypothetical protein